METNQEIAQATQGMRRLLAVAGVLVVIIGLPLYLVPQNSGEYFSWTVRTDLSAAFLGASYLSAAVIEFTAARERTWANARIAVPAVLVFTSLTMLVTLSNSGQYNYDASGFVQSAGTWAWLAVYVVVPPVMLVVLWMQFRRGGSDPARSVPITGPLRRLIAGGGFALLIGGVILLVVPDASSWMWPWTVRDLTARAIGCVVGRVWRRNGPDCLGGRLETSAAGDSWRRGSRPSAARGLAAVPRRSRLGCTTDVDPLGGSRLLHRAGPDGLAGDPRRRRYLGEAGHPGVKAVRSGPPRLYLRQQLVVDDPRNRALMCRYGRVFIPVLIASQCMRLRTMSDWDAAPHRNGRWPIRPRPPVGQNRLSLGGR